MRVILTFSALAFTLAVSAQDIVTQSNSNTETATQEAIVRKSIKEQLANPAQRDSITVINETVVISEQGDAAAIVDKNLQSEAKSINGYRIVVFMSNTQTARRDAVAVQENLATLFPQEHSYLTYENPYFKVAVGNCTSQEEAMILLGSLRKSFPKAFIMREAIDVSEFTR